MNLLFVVTNTKRKSVVFVTNTLKAFSLSEMKEAVAHAVFEGLYMVTGTAGTYIRSAPDKTAKNNIDTLSITGVQLALIAQGNAISTPAIHRYVQQYIESLPEGGPYVEPVGSFRIPRAVVKEVFQSHTPIIKKAAKEFAIDQFTLGAIVIDEIARMTPFEPIYEKLQVEVVGRWVSVGVAQVSIDTANDLIGRGLYNPNPNDTKLPFPGNLANKDRRYLYRYVVEPKHNIRFAAAIVRDIIDFWSTYVDLSDRPEIIGTLYHKGRGDPHSNPMPNKRGVQIADEFYGYAKQWLT